MNKDIYNKTIRLWARMMRAVERHRTRYSKILTAAVVIISIIAPMVNVQPAHAATANIVPNTDVTGAWTVLGGTSDATCAGGTHCDYVDEGATANTADYVSTGTALGTGIVEEYALSTIANVASVSQVVVWAHLQSFTNANGTILDTVGINLRIGGTLQTATTVTPAFNTWGWFSATFTGSWTQAQLDGMQAYMVRNVVGTGSLNSQDDDIRLASVYAGVTYIPSTNLNQSSYGWFNNQDATGSQTFIKAAGGTGADNGQSLVQTSDGGYAVTGWTNSYGAGGDDMFLAKYNSSGTLSYSRTWGGTGADNGLSLVQTSDGGYAVTGQTNSYGAGGTDMFLAKYGSGGTLSYSRTWGGTGYDSGSSLVQTSDGGYAVTGRTNSYGAGGDDMFLAKYDSSGTLSYSRTWGGTGADNGQSLVQTSDGGYAVTGDTYSYGAGLSDMFVAKYDSGGTLSNSNTLGDAGYDSGISLVAISNGGYVVAGNIDNFSASFNDMFLAEYDSGGTLGLSSTWGGTTGSEYGNSLVRTSDGGYAVTGQTDSYGAGAFDIFLAKYDNTLTIYGCGVSCSSPTTATTSSPAATTSSPTATTSSPAATTSSPAATTSSPAASVTTIVALGPSIDVGTTLAASNTAANAPAEGTAFRLRLNMHITVGDLGPSAGTFKLQYAARGVDNSCDTSFTNETYGDVGTAGSSLRYYNNPSADDGQSLTTNSSDPTHGSDTLVRQSYEESNTFTSTSTIAIGQDGMWDFALVDAGAPASTHYCFRAVKSDNSLLSTYTVIPEIITASGTFDQSGYRTFENKAKSVDSFIKTWGSTSAENGNAIVATSDGGYAITGYTNSYGIGGSDMFLAKYDSTGSLSFSRTWGGVGSDSGNALVATADGGYAITGYTINYGAGSNDMFLAKYDSAGSLSFSRTWGGTSGDIGYSLVQTSDGGYAVTGSTNSYGDTANGDMFLAKYDSAGSLSFSRTWGGTAADIGRSLVQTSDGGYAITGDTNTYGAGGDMFLAKYDSAGSISFSRTWGGTSTEIGNSLVQTSDGGYAVTGQTTSYGTGGIDMFIAKYDSIGSIASCGIRCQSPTAGTSSPTASTSSPAAGTSSPTPGTSSPTVGTSTPTPFEKIIAGAVTVAKAWGGAGTDSGNSLVATSDGGYAVTGQTGSFGSGGNDMFIAKYDSAGALSWSRTWGGAGSDVGYGIVQTTDGGYAVTGTTAYGAGGGDMFLARYDSAGTLTFSRAWGGTGADYGIGLVQTTDGGYAVTGYTNSYGAGVLDMFLAKYDSAGTLSFSRIWGGTGNEAGRSIVQTTDGGYAIAGDTTSFGAGGGDMFLAKYDSAGTLIFSQTWGGTLAEFGRSLVQTSDGGYAVTGDTLSYGAGSNDMFLAKFDASGTLNWSLTWGGTVADYGLGIIQTVDGGYAVAGQTANYGGGGIDMILAKYDAAGTLSFSRTWGGAGTEVGASIVQTSDGGYAETGQTASYGGGGIDMFLAKYDSLGNISGCSTICTSPTPTTSSPAATTAFQTPTTSSPAVTNSSPVATVTTPAPTDTTVTAAALTSFILPGSPLTAANSVAELHTTTSIFRLRIGMHVDNKRVPAGQAFRLQYALSDGICDNSVGESYSDVGSSSSAIAYYDNAWGVTGDAIAATGYDPNHSGHTNVMQSYVESNNFLSLNTILVGQDGVWGFSLKSDASSVTRAYCFRIVTGAGATLTTYTSVGSVFIPPNMTSVMRGGKFFNNQSIRQPFSW